MKRQLILLIVAALLSGCATYHPAPLEPASLEHRFDARTLSNPGLCDYLKANLGSHRARSCPPGTWALPQLTLAALYYSPELAVAAAHVDVARAAIITAAERPNPSIGLGPAVSVSKSPSMAPWGIGVVNLNFPIETAGRRELRITRAERLADAAALSMGRVAWTVRSRVRSALLNYLMARIHLKLVKAEVRTDSAITRYLRERVREGETPQPILTLALANLAKARLRMAQAQSVVPQWRTRLAAAIGVPVSALHKVRLTWRGMMNPPVATSLAPARIQRLAMLNRLDLRRALIEYEAADENLKLQIARQYPNINLGGGYSWGTGDNTFELMPVVALPLMNQNQGPIAQARARRTEQARRFAALQDRIIAQTAEALAGYRGALGVLAQARRSERLQQSRLEAARNAYAAGETGALTLETSKLAALSARQSALAALGNAQTTLGVLEDAVEHPLGPDHLKAFELPPNSQAETSSQSDT